MTNALAPDQEADAQRRFELLQKPCLDEARRLAHLRDLFRSERG